MKSIKDLTFTDDFMFGEIMKNEEICKGIIERLLHIKIEKLKLITLQETIAPYYETRGVRFDVYVKDSDKVYDIEVQNKKFTEIEKRTRYYQSMIDIDMLAKGANFKELKESYVIFICKTDPFDLGEPCYKVKSIFENHPEKEFDDKTHKVFYNASAYKKETDPEIFAFLQYVRTNVPEDDFTAGIFENVEKAKENEQFRSEYMRCNIHDFDKLEEGKEIGIAIGEARGEERGRSEAKLEAARNMLLKNVGTIEQIAEITGLSLETVQQFAQELHFLQ
ncbi:MAG: Rpn family recombination-promoting nuclease/putative transposase [Spirochaetaceae bacterium]|nr:Rpn family recombination-promoting nuclease/putative transposase [Spirochaetaceae bacterium]